MKLVKKIQQLKHLPNKTSGFTLVEMLIVVAILAIVVAIAVPALNRAKLDAQLNKRKTVESALAQAAVRAMLDPNFNKYNQNIAFADVAPYLLINGKKPNNIFDLSNGTGATLSSSTVGRFPRKDGTHLWGNMILIGWLGNQAR